MSNSNFETKFEFEGGGGTVATTKTIKNYSQADIGDNPSINLATGRLRYSFADLNVGYGNFAIGISHVYVSDVFKSFADKFKHYGNNWKLNVSQCVIKEENNLLYMDAEGEIHRFVKFDGNRYYDERNAKTTLTSDTSGYVITDGVGNKWRFNAKGLLTEGISCHNAEIRKIYNYDANDRLISVYDKRTQINNVAKTRIELTYDDKGRLASMTSYVKFNKKASQLQYGYDNIGNLVSVRQSAFITTDKPCASKQILQFNYLNSLLTMAEDCETKSAQTFAFDASKRLTKTSQGIVTYDGIALGAQDAASNTVELGAVECGTFDNRTFTPIKFNKFRYDFSLFDGISVQTDVTNENGITLTYFIDRNACITSSFEKMPDGKLKTLSKQGAKRTDKLTLNADGYINGKQSCTGSGTLNLNLGQSFNIARNKLEENCKHFNYSFWLKTLQTYEVLEVRLTCGYNGYNNSTAKAYVNAAAKNAWQKVMLPLTVPTDADGKCVTDALQSIKLEFFANKSAAANSVAYEINEIGFEPALYSEMHLAQFSGNFSLSSVDKVTYNGVRENISKDLYFTESDIMATFTNKFKNKPQTDFDIICNNGTKRLKANGLQFYSGQLWTVENDTPFKIVTYTPTDQYSEISYRYNFPLENGAKNITTFTRSKIDNNMVLQGVTAMDYFGSALLEQDSYNVRKKYFYDEFGNLIKEQIIGSDDVIGSSVNYHYNNSEGYLTQINDELRGQQFFYDENGLKSATDGVMSNGALQTTPHKTDNVYGVFNDKTLSVTEFDGVNKLAQNEITYQDGRIRTVTDGAAKYGAKYDAINNSVEYTQFDGNNEILLQKDSVSSIKDNVQTHKSEYYSNNQLNSYTSVDVDKYGKTIKSEKWNKSGDESETCVYEYDNVSESRFANEPKKRVNADGTVTEYVRDNDGNLVSVAQYCPNADSSGSYKLICGIQQVEENTTRYMFEDDSNQYFTSVVTDPAKTGNPRIDSVKNMWYRYAYTDYQVKDYPIYCQQYAYDNFGRLISSNDSGYYTCAYEYLNNTNLIKSVTYRNNMPLKEGMGSAGSADVKQDERLNYYPNGCLKSEEQDYSFNVHNIKANGSVKNEYSYDNARRLTRHIFTQTKNNTVRKEITDFSYSSNGRLQQVVQSGSNTLSGGTPNTYSSSNTYMYNRLGQLTSMGRTTFSYDAYGNRTSKSLNTVGEHINYSYKFGGLLSKISGTCATSEYKYNADGIRTKKTVDGVETKYYLDGNKILREVGKNTITYFYGKDGLLGFRIGADEYTYVRDSQGNITMLFSVDKPYAIARYEYDVFGNCTVYDSSNNKTNTDPNFIGNINPFRWKSFYYDVESGLYYANGSYYDPQTGMYINALSLNTTIHCALFARYLDRHSILCDNVIDLISWNMVYRSKFDDEKEQIINISLAEVPRWLGPAKFAASAGLSASLAIRMGWYLIKNPEIAQLMKFDGITQLPGKYTKLINGLAYGFVFFDTAVDIYSNLQQEKSPGYIIGSATYTLGTGLATIWASAKLGAAIGSLGGPAALIAGAIIGFIMGVALEVFFTWLKGEIFK